MATNSGWSKSVPSGASRVSSGDDEIRSFKSYMQEWWEEEHYGTDGSAASAGVHKLGTARAFVGTTSQLSNPTGDNAGRLMHTTDDGGLYVANASTSSWTLLTNSITLGSDQTWTGTQEFDSAILDSNFTIQGQGAASSWTIAGITSGFTRLAAAVTVNVGANGAFAMVGASNLTYADVVCVGVEPSDSATPDLLVTGTVTSAKSVYIQAYNVGAVNRTLPSGSTVRYVAFRANR